MASNLDAYSAKRDFDRTPEPAARKAPKSRDQQRIFVVQHHKARRDHFDLRLEIDGTLKSWAVTRGPSALPKTRRLAVRTEDHPLDYANFEGVIPKNSYGAGPVMLWDRGTWSGLSDAEALKALSEGHLKFTLHGERMQGRWALVRMGQEGPKENWLLIKDRDALAEEDDSLATRFETSIASGRTFEEIDAGKPPRKRVQKNRNASKAKPRKPHRFISPMLCTLTTRVPRGDDWLFEMKYDGYRLQLVTGGDNVTIFTRNGHDWTTRFPEIARAARTLPPMVLDGEVVVFNSRGLSDFSALAAALGSGPAAPMTFVAFDVLRSGGRDVTRLPLLKRKALLTDLLSDFEIPELIRISPTLQGDGQHLLEQIADSGGEGLIAKRLSSIYRSGRSDSWLKIKAIARDDVVVIGFTPSEAGRAFASLAVAREEDGILRYCGRVGTGFTARKEAQLAPLLARWKRRSPPDGVEGLDLVPGRVQWVTPKLTISVRYRGTTNAGILRAASYLGLREDVAVPAINPKRAKAVPTISPSQNSKPVKVPLTHADRVLFPDCGLTKRDLADYYARAAKLMLPYLIGRPVSLVRAPDGLSGETFFQRHPMPAMKKGIIRVADPAKSHPDYMAVDGSAGLATIVQFGGIELHGWGARLPRLDKPDRLVIDLDPDDKVTFKTVRESAFLMKDVLASCGLKSFAMVTGGKGVHVVVPLSQTQSWDDISEFSAGVARHLTKLEPDAFIDVAIKKRRKGKIFIDWLRNKSSATAIMPYSVRARAGAPVAVPVSWSALRTIESANAYDMKTAPLSGRNPWAGYFSIDQAINPAAMELIRR